MLLGKRINFQGDVIVTSIAAPLKKVFVAKRGKIVAMLSILLDMREFMDQHLCEEFEIVEVGQREGCDSTQRRIYITVEGGAGSAFEERCPSGLIVHLDWCIMCEVAMNGKQKEILLGRGGPGCNPLVWDATGLGMD